MHVVEIVVGTRGSVLARWQAEQVRSLLGEASPEIPTSVLVVRTEGDRRQDVPFAAFQDRGVFVKELESALLAKQIDVAVHSAKDVPTELPEGLALVAALPRHDPRDALVGCRLADLPKGARVGTSSARRRAGLARVRPDLVFRELRGNLDTRLRKLDEGQCDAVVLACAGLDRLGLSERIAERLDPDVSMPAPGQAIVCVEARADDARVRDAMKGVDHPESMLCLLAERAFLHALGGGCRVPIGALATLEGGALHIRGRVTGIDGTRCVEDALVGDAERPADAGRALGERLLAAGAADILNAT